MLQNIYCYLQLLDEEIEALTLSKLTKVTESGAVTGRVNSKASSLNLDAVSSLVARCLVIPYQIDL